MSIFPAILAFACFVLALFGVHPAGFDLVIAGLMFIALTLILSGVPAPWRKQ